MNRATALRSGATAAALLVVCAAGTAVAAAEPKVTAKDGKQVMVVTGVQTAFEYTPNGGKPTQEFPETPGVGDRFVVTEDLSQDGVAVGKATGPCTFPTAETVHCEVTFSFAGGTFQVVSTTGLDDDQPDPAPLSGGTGAYAGIAGVSTVASTDDESHDFTFTYTTGGGQVSPVPAGGAQTGRAGSAAEGEPDLIALGALAMAAGAIALGAGRLRGRRTRS